MCLCVLFWHLFPPMWLSFTALKLVAAHALFLCSATLILPQLERDGIFNIFVHFTFFNRLPSWMWVTYTLKLHVLCVLWPCTLELKFGMRLSYWNFLTIQFFQCVYYFLGNLAFNTRPDLNYGSLLTKLWYPCISFNGEVMLLNWTKSSKNHALGSWVLNEEWYTQASQTFPILFKIPKL